MIGRPVILSLLLIASSAAGEEPLYRDFGKGPAQWIMTGEEQKAWRAVKSEDGARDFAELFWVRRDPTSGTFVNEFRNEFDARVEFADRKFREPNKRGALTERGRVLVALGFPTNMSDDASRNTMTGQDAELGGHGTAARDVWKYEPRDAQKYGLPKIEVVFIHDGVRGEVRRDPQRMDFTTALPGAIRYAIRNPELKEVPEWAKFEMRKVDMHSVEVAAPGHPSAGEADGTTPVLAAAQPPRSLADARDDTRKPAGAGRLTLVKDAWSIKPQSGKDPFIGLKALESFRKSDELGWAAEYCTGTVSEDLQGVKVQVTISGLINGEKINFRGEPEEMVPDSIKATPGCYVVRGAIPLSDFDSGTYTLSITLGSYNLKKEFKVD